MNLASRPSRRFRLVAAALLTLAGLAAPAGASASCAIPPGGADDLWKSADAVFVGTVTAIANNARWATVRVEEVWQGPDQPAEVVVRGGPEGNTATSVDRSYTVGIRYLFAVVVVDGRLEDSACSGTTEAGTIDLNAIRPADVRRPEGATVTPGGPDLGALAGPVVVVGIVGGLLLATVLLARRRDA